MLPLELWQASAKASPLAISPPRRHTSMSCEQHSLNSAPTIPRDSAPLFWNGIHVTCTYCFEPLACLVLTAKCCSLYYSVPCFGHYCIPCSTSGSICQLQSQHSFLWLAHTLSACTSPSKEHCCAGYSISKASSFWYPSPRCPSKLCDSTVHCLLSSRKHGQPATQDQSHLAMILAWACWP